MYSWKERLADWWHRVTGRWELTREALVHILMSVFIALVLTGIILAIAMSGIRADINHQADYFDDRLGATRQSLNDSLATTQQSLRADYDGFGANVTQQLDDWWDAVDTIMTSLHEDTVIMQGKLDQLEADLASVSFNESAAYVAGAFPDYSLYVWSLPGGNFTANVHLHYSPGIGGSSNYTAALDYFCTATDWTGEAVPSYVCQPSFNGTAWVITDIWFNVGTFILRQNREIILPVPCVGLNTTWVPALVYADVFRLSG